MPATVHMQWRRGFTLLEVLVASVILLLVMGILLSMTDQTHKASRYASSKIEAFQNARLAFETVSRSLSLATLNTYYDYYDASRNRRTPANAASFVPDVYGRYSELEFVCGKNLVQAPRAQVTHAVFFQSPLNCTQERASYGNLQGLLNTMGFYVEFNNDNAVRPSFVPSPVRWRYRLMQLTQPSENLAVYSFTNTHTWFSTPIASGSSTRPLAENIIACVFLPMAAGDDENSSIAPEYEYDSNIATASPAVLWQAGAAQPACMNQLPPVVRIVMIAVDERSMIRWQGNSSTAPDFGFDYTKIFQKSSSLKTDLATVSEALNAKHINYRIFQTDVAIRGAKWTP